MTKILRIIISGLILLLITACQAKKSVLLDTSDCLPPCWRNITPGETSKIDAINSIQKMPEIDTNSLSNEISFKEYLSDNFTWRFKDALEYSGGMFFLHDSVLSAYWTYRNQISLEELIKRMGNPSHILITTTKFEMIYLTVYFIYDDKGICFEHHTSLNPFMDENIYLVNPSTNISYVYYIDPSIQQGQFLFGCLIGFPQEMYMANIQIWEGYGNYKNFSKQ